MGTWGLIQIVIDIFFSLGLFIVVMRISRQPKDDPRLSRGLQLLQAKIAVLEDLSDRTETQVQQMISMLEQKAREVQNKIQLADRHVQLVRTAMDRSLEVAKIFQDKIPHQEIIERQNTLKYLQAARLAHQGKSSEEIARVIDLPKGEIEFIAKVNRDQLMFSEDQLPDWARAADPSLDLVTEPPTEDGAIDSDQARLKAVSETARLSQLAGQQELVENLRQVQREMNEMLNVQAVPRDMSEVFTVPKPPTESLARLGEEFRKARTEAEAVANHAAAELSFFELDPQTESISESGPLLGLSPEQVEELKNSFKANQTAAQPAEPSAPKAPAMALAASPAPVKPAPRPRAVVAPKAPMAVIEPIEPKARALAQARAAAHELKKPQPVVRKVEFPRIGSVKPTDNLG